MEYNDLNAVFITVATILGTAFVTIWLGTALPTFTKIAWSTLILALLGISYYYKMSKTKKLKESIRKIK